MRKQKTTEIERLTKRSNVLLERVTTAVSSFRRTADELKQVNTEMENIRQDCQAKIASLTLLQGDLGDSIAANETIRRNILGIIGE